MGVADGFPGSVKRKDPYKGFKFQIVSDGKPILGVSKISALKRTTEVVTHPLSLEVRSDFVPLPETVERLEAADPKFQCPPKRSESVGPGEASPSRPQ